MFNKLERIEELERRINEWDNEMISLKAELTEGRVLRRYMNSAMDTTYKAISLEELQTTQQRIFDYLNVEIKTTEAKTELVKKLK